MTRKSIQQIAKDVAEAHNKRTGRVAVSDTERATQLLRGVNDALAAERNGQIEHDDLITVLKDAQVRLGGK